MELYGCISNRSQTPSAISGVFKNMNLCRPKACSKRPATAVPNLNEFDPAVYNRRIHSILVLVFKALHGLTPEYISKLFTFRHCNIELRGANILSLPRADTTSYGLHSLSYYGSHYQKSRTFCAGGKLTSFCAAHALKCVTRWRTERAENENREITKHIHGVYT